MAINEFKKEIVQITFKVNSIKSYFHVNKTEEIEEYFVIEKLVEESKDGWKIAGFIDKNSKYVKPTITKLLNMNKK